MPGLQRDPNEVLDELLLLRCQSGETAALEQLAARWDRRFAGFAYRLTGEPEAAREVVQEAWVAIVRGLRGLHDPASFRSWAYRIVHRKAVDQVRRLQRRRAFDRRLTAEPRIESSEPGDEAQILPRLKAAMATLAPDRRAILGMFYSDGMTTREIASALEIPEGTVKTRLFHTRQQLRSLLEEER